MCGRLPGLADLPPQPPLSAVAEGLTSGGARPPARRPGPATLTFKSPPRTCGFTPFQTEHTEARAGGRPALAFYDLLPLPGAPLPAPLHTLISQLTCCPLTCSAPSCPHTCSPLPSLLMVAERAW